MCEEGGGSGVEGGLNGLVLVHVLALGNAIEQYSMTCR